MGLRKIKFGKLVFRDQEKNMIIGIFENQNAKGTKYGTISITALKGIFKESMEVSIPEFKSFLTLIERMPEIEVKQQEKKKRGRKKKL